VGFGPDAMTARQALELATLGGAKVLNRDDVGAIAPGMMADLAIFDLNRIGLAGQGTILSPPWCSVIRGRSLTASSTEKSGCVTDNWPELNCQPCCISITNWPENWLVESEGHFIREATKNKADYICYCSHYYLEYALPVIRENQRLD